MTLCPYCQCEIDPDPRQPHACPTPDLQDFFAVLELAARAAKEGRFVAAATVFNSAGFLLSRTHNSDAPLNRMLNGAQDLARGLREQAERIANMKRWATAREAQTAGGGPP